MAKTLKQIFEQANDLLIDGLREELTNQGHHLTGALEQSIKAEIVETGDAITSTATMNSYGLILDAGVTSDRIPYSGSHGNGGTSQYIQGLISYFILRGLSEKEAKSAAFATANAHKNEGMPTYGSYGYSNNNLRTDFIKATLEEVGDAVDRVISEGYDDLVDEVYNLTPSERI